MSMLTREEVLHIAQLARLGLREDEIEKFQKQLSEILSYVDKLSEVKTENIEPTLQATGLLNCFRSDVVSTEPLAAPDDLLKISRNFDETTHSILVPNVFE